MPKLPNHNVLYSNFSFDNDKIDTVLFPIYHLKIAVDMGNRFKHLLQNENLNKNLNWLEKFKIEKNKIEIFFNNAKIYYYKKGKND